MKETGSRGKPMKLAIGNILYFWERQQIEDFYQQAKTSSADIIYIGESVCSKRRELKLDNWIDLGKEIEACGKQVVLSSLALLEAKSEFSMLKKVCTNHNFLVEANDFGAVQILHEAGLPFIAGSALNIYNQHDLNYLYKKGMQRWVMPVELSKDWLINIRHELNELNLKDKFEIEVYGYGHLPLAYAARCFTARSENKPKDQCELSCIKYPKGREIKSQEGDMLFNMNGIQTLSGKAQNLINDLPSMNGLVDIVRINPNSLESLTWLTLFRHNLDGKAPISLDGYCNGYWHKIEGMACV